MATEIELKLRILDDIGSAVESVGACLKALGIDDDFQLYELKNTYFDTNERILNANKMALRIRDKQGKYIQTLKTKGRSVQGLSERGEWEWLLPKFELDGVALQACEAWPDDIDIKTLSAAFETNFTRRQLEFTWQASRIELALDQGVILSQGKLEKINEIELELKTGNENGLHSLGAELQKFLLLAPSDISKAERGYRLFGR
mgnify:CR=1 FL=1